MANELGEEGERRVSGERGERAAEAARSAPKAELRGIQSLLYMSM